MISIATETRKPEIYSILPCPKGCSESGLCPEIRNPIKVIIEDPASDRLLNASAVMAIDPLKKPAIHFPRKRRIFKPIPTAPQRVP